MSWENRSRSYRRYFCRTLRAGGRIKRVYIGPEADPTVQLIAKEDALSRAESAAAVNQVRAEQSAFKQLEPLLAALEERAQAAITAGMENRWTMDGNGHNQGGSKGDTEPLSRELLDHLANQANKGDADAGKRLRQLLRRHPEIWQEVGDLGRHVEQCLIDLVAAGNLVLRESLRLKACELRASLSQPDDDALAQLLVDHTSHSWLECQLARMAAIQPQETKGDARFWQGRHERAEARYLASIERLASVRKLLAGDRDQTLPITINQQAAEGSSD